MRLRRWLSLLALCAAAPHAPALEYTVRTLRHPNAGQTSGSKGNSINNSGQVSGSASAASGSVTACVWNPDGTFLVLPDIPGGVDEANAIAINTAGQCVGWGMIGQTLASAAYWDNGTVFDLGTLPLHNKSSAALGISDSGWVVGGCKRDTGGTVFSTAFVWKDGFMSALPHLSENQSISSASAVNSSGLVVGTSRNQSGLDQPVYWLDGQLRLLPQLPGAVDTGGAVDVNEEGTVCGYSTISFVSRAVAWFDGEITDIGLEGEWSLSEAVNALNQVVARTSRPWFPDDSFLWSRATGRFYLSPLANGIENWLGLNAYDINDKGQICGEADVPNPSGSGYHREGFLLTPVSTVVAPSAVTVLFGQKQSGEPWPGLAAAYF